ELFLKDDWMQQVELQVEVQNQQQPYLDHPERFDMFCQLLCKNGLAGHCYWEVEWEGKVDVAVTHRGILRKGYSSAARFGGNDQSWSLNCSDEGYSAWHDDRETPICSSSISNRVAVYVDCPAGTLSFYRVSSDTLIHLHTFNITFTQLLYPGFRVWEGSVTLCSFK
uniref:B30.2/SPRY domain-containing protein n=1 Tax=Amphilophus citrinellus TaxID=61819 RepID=A0A3Q0R7S8_AMPCI